MTRRGTGPSGINGLTGVVADWWDRLPVGGGTILGAVVAAAVLAGGTLAALTNGGPGQGDCAKTPLVHVYRPQRLHVVATCQQITATVIAWRHEHDGDTHVNVQVQGGGWTNPANIRGQHGYTVVEFVPLMPRPMRFYGGQRLQLTGTRVLDVQHGGWIELHPVFAVRDVTPPAVTPAGNRPALAPRIEEDDGGR